jgi:putative nucleotidyltransferase with HDIG domain
MLYGNTRRSMMEEDYLEKLVMGSDKLSPEVRENVYIEMAHGIIVSNLARAVSEEMEHDDMFLDDITIAGLLHDIGKLRLNKYIDNSGFFNDNLVVEQMRYVRGHARFSRDILMEKKYPLLVIDSVYHHHENMNGTGYPDGLTGSKIPFMSRILRICDVFAALTSDRPYRKAFDPHTAVQLIIDEIENYDVTIFTAFQRMYHSDKYEKIKPINAMITDLQKEHLKLFIEVAEKLEQEEQEKRAARINNGDRTVSSRNISSGKTAAKKRPSGSEEKILK